jgi:hypothetical protein
VFRAWRVAQPLCPLLPPSPTRASVSSDAGASSAFHVPFVPYWGRLEVGKQRRRAILVLLINRERGRNVRCRNVFELGGGNIPDHLLLTAPSIIFAIRIILSDVFVISSSESSDGLFVGKWLDAYHACQGGIVRGLEHANKGSD